MITSCNFTAPNGEGSELSKYLITTYGAEEAAKMWDKLHSDEMLAKHNWLADGNITTDLGELNPQAAEYLLSNEPFSLGGYERWLNREVVPSEPAKMQIPSANEVKPAILTIDNTDKILSGTQSMLLRFVPIPGLKEPGDAAVAYIDGMAMAITYEGIRKSVSTDDKVALGFSPEEDLSGRDVTFDRVATWLEGNEEQHVYTVEPIHKLLDLVNELGIDTKEIPVDIDQAVLLRSLQTLLPEKLDAEGNPTGEYFSFEGLQDANNFLQLYLNRRVVPTLTTHERVTPTMLIDGLNDAKAGLATRIKTYEAFLAGKSIKNFPDITSETARRRLDNFIMLQNSLASVVPFALDRLSKAGITVNPKLKRKVAEKLAYKEIITDENEEGKPVEDIEDVLGEDIGRGVVDWTESAVNLNPLDTASKNVKFLLTAVSKSTFGKQTPPVQRVMPVPEAYQKSFLDNSKGFTNFAMTPEEVESLGFSETITEVSVVIGGNTYILSKPGKISTHGQGSVWFKARGIPYSEDLTAVSVKLFRPHNRQIYPAQNDAYGTPEFTDAGDLFNKVLREAQRAESYTEKGVMDALKNSNIPEVVRAQQILAKAPQSTINEFLTVAKKQYLEHLILLFATKRNGQGNTSLFATPINANKNSEQETLISNWREAQKTSKLIKEVDGVQMVDYVEADKLRKSITKMQAKLAEFKRLDADHKLAKTSITEEENHAADAMITEARKVLKGFFKTLGVKMTNPVLDKLLGERAAKSLRFTDAEEFFNSDLQTLVNALFDGDNENDVQLKNNNPLYSEKRIISDLAKAIMPTLDEPEFGTSHRTAEGKTAYAFTHHTYESRTFQELKRPDSELAKKMRSNFFTKNSWLLDEIANGDVSLQYLDAMQNTRNSDATVRADMSPREQLVMAITAFESNGGLRGSFVDMTKSDKSMTPIISGLTKMDERQARMRFLEIFQAERARIELWHSKRGEVNNDQFQRGGGFFYFIPDLNFESLKELLEAGVVSQEQVDALWNADGSPALNGNRHVLASLVDKVTTRMVKAETVKLTKKAMKMGIITSDTYLLSDNALRKFANANYDYNKATNGYNDPITKRPIPTKELYERAGLDAIYKYITHGMIFNSSMAMAISGDPAMFYKAPKGPQTTKAQVKSTLTEYQKRLAKDIAPGSDANWDPSQPTFKALTIYDTKIDTELFGKIDSAADAQEITTVREHLYVMYSNGKLADKTYADMIAIIDKGLTREDKYYEFTSPEHMAVVMQAMKPVYVNRRFDDNGLMFIDYVKSSSFPLLPQLTASREMEALRIKMEGEVGGKGHIARAHFASAKKSGRPSNPVVLFKEDGTIDLEVLNSPQFTDAVIELSREGFRIQQEVPYEAEKAKIHVVTQMDKLFVEGIADVQDFQVGERVLTGAELRAAKEANRKATYQLAYEEFVKKVGGVKEDGSLLDPRRFYDMLVEEAIDRDYPKTDIDALKQRINANNELRIPLWFNGSIGKLEPMILSLITKIVVNKVPGKSYIQASSLGMKPKMVNDVEDKSGIVLTGSPNYDHSKGLQFMRTVDGKVLPAQVMIPFNFYDADGNALDIKNFLIEGTNQLDPAKITPELLELVGARIPNQGFSSMIPLEVVGFLPNTMGDLVMVPAEITAQMGADFDVDKLYTYKRNYIYTDGVLSKDPSESGEKQLQAEYFDMHWGVLTHPEMFAKITSPLDKQDLVEEMQIAQAIKGEEESTYFFSPTQQLDDYAAQKDAKVLVAVSSLWSTFGADIQSHDVKLVRTVMTEEGPKAIPYHVTMKDDNGDTIKLHHLSQEGVSSYNGDPRSKIINNTIQQNEFLDYSKNRTIDFFNLNRITYPASAVLSLLSDKDGNGVDLRYNTRLLQQEIIKEYVELMDGNDGLSSEFTPDLRGSVVSQLMTKYMNLAGIQDSKDFKADAFNPDELLQMLQGDVEKDASYYKNQLSVLDTFNTLSSIADTLGSIMGTYNTDSKGPGGTMLKVMDRIAKDSQEVTSLSGIGKFLNGSQKGKAFDLTVGTADGVFSPLFPYVKLEDTLGSIAILMGKDAAVDLREPQMQLITNHVKAYMLSLPVAGISDNPSKKIASLVYDTPAGESLAKRVRDAKESWGSNNYFLRRLHTDIATASSKPSTVNYNGMKASSSDVEENFKGFLELLMGNEAQRALGHDLAAYALLTNGSGGAASFLRYLPTVFYTGTGLDKHLRDFMKADAWTGYLKNFNKQFIQHNPAMVPQLDSHVLKNAVGYTKGIVNEFISVRESGDTALSRYMHTRHKGVVNLYQYTMSEAGITTYQRIDTLGNGRIKEYDPVTSDKRSVILVNRALFAPMDVGDQNQTTKVDGMPVEDPNPTIIAEGSFLNSTFFGGKSGESLANVVEQFPQEEAPLLHLLHSILHQAVPEAAFTVDSTAVGPDILGQYQVGTNRIKLSAKNLGSASAVATVLTHELAHGLTAKVVADIKKLTRKSAVAKYGAAVVDAYNNIDALRLRVQKELPNTPTVLEATSSVEEFIAYALADETFQNHLNGLEGGQKSLFDELLDIVRDLITALAKQFGIDVVGGSALESSLQNIGVLLTASNKLKLSSFQSPAETLNAKRLNADTFSFDSDFDNSNEVPQDIQQAISDLIALRKRLMNMQVIAKTDSDEARAAYQNRQVEINTIEAEISQIEKAGDYAMLMRIGERQLDWAQSIYNKKNLSFNEYLSALRVANTWTNLIDKVYQTGSTESRPEEFDAIYGKASQIANGIEKKFKETVVLEGGEIITSIEDFNPVNMGVGLAAGYTLDLGQAKSNVAQALYDTVAGVNRVKGQDVTKLRAEISHFQKKIDAYIVRYNKTNPGAKIDHQGVMDKLIQKDNWGLVDKFTPAFHHFQNNLRASLEKQIERANLLTDEPMRQRMIQAAKAEFRKKLGNNMTHVDFATLLDVKTGERAQGAAATKAFESLVAEVGDDLATTMITQAENFYKEYLEDKESYETELETILESNIAALPTIFAGQLKELPKADRAAFLAAKAEAMEKDSREKIQYWVNENSPIKFYQWMNGDSLYSKFRAYDKLVMIPKANAPDGVFFDTAYAEITADPDLYEIYNFIRDKFSTYVQFLPTTVNADLNNNFIPYVQRGSVVSNVTQAAEYVTRSVMEGISTEADYLDSLDSARTNIPIRYLSGRNLEPKDQERDLMVLLEKFGKMSLHFKYMSQVQSYAELMQQVVVSGVRDTGSGNFSKQNKNTQLLADQVDHFLNTIMYERAKEKEGRIGKLYADSPFKLRKAAAELEKLKDEETQAYEDLTKMPGEEGSITKAEYDAIIKRVRTRKTEILDKERVVTGSDIGDVAIKITQLKALSYNPISALANLSFGVISTYIHAAGGVDFTSKEVGSALATMTHATRRSVSFGAVDSPVAKKILALMERLDTMGDLLDADIAGGSRVKAKREGWKKVLSPYQMLRQSDYFAKGLIAVAMAKHQKVVVDGKEMSLWDAVDDNGEINAEGWSHADPTTATEFIKFQNRTVGVTKIIMGNQDSSSPILIKKKVLGRLVSQFRTSWMAEGANSRFQDEHMNHQLGRKVKGRYKSVHDLGYGHSAMMFLQQALSTFNKNDPYKDSKGKPLSALDMENMKRNFAEARWFLYTTALLLIVKSTLDDDDDEGTKKSTKLLINIILRNHQDIGFYVNTSSAMDISGSLIPSVRVLTDFEKAISGTVKLMTKDENSRFTGEDAFNRWMKVFPYTSLYPKFNYMTDRVLD